MKILYVSSYVDKNYFNEIFNSAKTKPIQNIQKFNNLLIDGLKVQPDIDKITILSNAPVNRGISSKLFWKFKINKIENTEFVYLPFINIKFIKQFCLSVFCLFFSLFWCICNHQDSVIISDGFYPINSTICTIMGKIFGINVITLYTDLPKIDAIDALESKTFLKRIVKAVKNIGDNVNIHLSDGFILLTEKMNNIVNKKNKPYIVIEGLADSKFKPLINVKRKKAIMYAGGLYEKYGVKLLIDSFIEWNNPDYELWLCGGNGDLIDYIEKINKENIKYFGTLSNDKVVKLEQECSLLVNPRSTKDEYTKYSFPSKNIEYMLSGTPFLTTKLDGIPQEYDDYVFYLEDETKKGLIAKFKEIFKKSKTELNEFGNKAKNFVIKNKNNIVQAKKITKFLKSVDNQKENKIANKLILWYLCFNAIILLLSILNVYNLNSVSFKTYFYYILSIIFTILGIRFFTSKKSKDEKSDALSDKKIEKFFKSKLFSVILIFSLICVSYYCIKYFALILNADQKDYRMIAYTSLYGNAIGAIFFLYIVSNIGTIATILFPILIFDKKSRNMCNEWQLFIIFLIFLQYSLIGLGRIVFFKFILAIIFVFIYFYKTKEIFTKKNLKIIFSGLLITFVISCVIIYFRVFDSGLSFMKLFNILNYQFKQIFEYFLGSLRMLDYLIINGFKSFPTITFGRATLAGIDEIVLYPIKLFNDNVYSFNQIISEITQIGLPIGKETPYYNAFYTQLMNFYLDFRVFGIIIFSFLYGIFIKYVINMYENNKNIITKILLIFISINLFLGILKWEYQSGNTMFLLIILLIIINFNKIKNYFIRGE